jgi:hypothetical protein
MATNITKLKGSKGAPPAAEAGSDEIINDTRGEKVAQRPIQVRVPEVVFHEFSERAGREFGFTHGAKKQLFLKMWKAYKAQNM